MNCDDFLPAMDLNDPAQVDEARRHAAICPQCAAAYAALLEVKAALAHHEPLSPAARAVWENAARAGSGTPTRRPNWTTLLAGVVTTTAACVVVVAVVLTKREVEQVPLRVNGPSNPIVLIEPDLTAELAQLATALETLDGSLVVLAERAERLDVEHEIAMTLKQYKRW